MSHEEVRSSPAGSGGHLLWGDHVVVLGPDRTMSEGYLTAEARAPGSRSTASSHLAGSGRAKAIARLGIEGMVTLDAFDTVARGLTQVPRPHGRRVAFDRDRRH